MRCPRCSQANDPHIVTVGLSTKTLLLPSPGYWDENDVWHPPHDPNRATTTYHCSNGHTWTETQP